MGNSNVHRGPVTRYLPHWYRVPTGFERPWIFFSVSPSPRKWNWTLKVFFQLMWKLPETPRILLLSESGVTISFYAPVSQYGVAENVLECPRKVLGFFTPTW